MIYTNEQSPHIKFDDIFNQKIMTASSIDIATGYVSKDTIVKYKDALVACAEQGQQVRVLVGMARYEGLAESTYNELVRLNANLIDHDVTSGVFICMVKKYHGKIFKFSIDGESCFFIGSSNFSYTGFNSNWECTLNVQHDDDTILIDEYLDRLFSTDASLRIDRVSSSILIKSKKKKLPSADQDAWENLEEYDKDTDTTFTNFDKSIAPYCSISLSRVVNNMGSSLNSYFGKGRLVRSTGQFNARDWYEVQIIVSAPERRNVNYPKGDFLAYTDDGLIIPMHTFGGSNNIITYKNMSSRSSERIFGKWIKGKLEKNGHLHGLEPITLEMLEDYGSTEIKLYKISEGKYYMTF